MGRKERGDFCRKRESRGWWRGSSFAGGKRGSRTRPGLGEVNGWPGPGSRVLLFAFRGLQPARNRRRARFARAKEGGLRRRGPRAETDRARAAQLTETVGRSVGQGRSARRPQDCSPSRFAHKAGRLRFRCGSLGLSPKRPAAASAVSAGKPHPPPSSLGVTSGSCGADIARARHQAGLVAVGSKAGDATTQRKY